MNLGWIWPRISDEVSAKDAIDGGFWACLFIVIVDVAIAIYALVTHKKFAGDYDAWILVDAALFAVIAWRLRKKSRPWSVVGLILMGFEAVGKLQGEASTFGVVTALLFLAILNATSGTFAFHKYEVQQASLAKEIVEISHAKE